MKVFVVSVDDRFVSDFDLRVKDWVPSFSSVELTEDIDDAKLFYETSDMLDIEMWESYYGGNVTVELREWHYEEHM